MDYRPRLRAQTLQNVELIPEKLPTAATALRLASSFFSGVTASSRSTTTHLVGFVASERLSAASPEQTIGCVRMRTYYVSIHGP